MTGEEIAKEILQDYSRLSGDRGPLESHLQEIAERVLPAYSGAFTSNGIGRTPGEKRTEFIFDSTATIGLGRFAAVVDSLLTPFSSKWHRLRASDPYIQKQRDVREYFEETSDILWKFRRAPKANFQSQNHESFRMLGAFGTGTLFCDKNTTEKGLRYRAIHLGEIYFDENHQGVIDKAIRRYERTARQIMQRWPNLKSEQIANTMKEGGNPNKKFFVLHCVKPRTDLDPTRKDYRGMAFASYYVLECEKSILEEGGYRTWPYPTSRYYQAPGEIYGRSPAMDVLPAIKTLNEMKKTVLKQGHRTVDPILLMHDDGVLDSFSLLPGAMNAGGVNADGRALVHTLPIGRVDIGKELMDDERAVVNDAFLVTLFQILTETPEMTATEVLERVKEKGILLNPTVGRQQSEYLGPLIERELDVLAQQGLLPPIPGALLEAQGDYTVEYDSPMARVARAEEASGLMRSVESTLRVVEITQNPEPMDWYDWDTIVPEVNEINGTPARWMRTLDKVEAIREGRAEQAQTRQMVEAAPAVAGLMKAAPQGAPA